MSAPRPTTYVVRPPVGVRNTWGGPAFVSCEARLQRLVGEVSVAQGRLASAQQSGDQNDIALRRAQLEAARDIARSVKWWLVASARS